MEIMINGTIKAIMGKGVPLPDCPKTYKKVAVVKHSIGDIFNPNQNLYNSATMTVYKAKDDSLRYEIYRDGCFFPFYGKLFIVSDLLNQNKGGLHKW